MHRVIGRKAKTEKLGRFFSFPPPQNTRQLARLADSTAPMEFKKQNSLVVSNLEADISRLEQCLECLGSIPSVAGHMLDEDIKSAKKHIADLKTALKSYAEKGEVDVP